MGKGSSIFNLGLIGKTGFRQMDAGDEVLLGPQCGRWATQKQRKRKIQYGDEAEAVPTVTGC